MKVNSEDIYGSRRFHSFGQGENIRFTQSNDGKTLYVFVFEFPDVPLVLNGPGDINFRSVRMLGSDRSIRARQIGKNLEVKLPAGLRSSGEHVWVLKIQ
jgi:alpha-L-fucosidase